MVKELDRVVIRFSGDSGDGMQLVGNIFSNISAILGNAISTFPDYPAEMRAPQGSLGGVSGFQVHLGSNIKTPGDKADVLVAMNPAALKTNVSFLNKDSVIIIDEDSFGENDLKKAEFKTDNPFEELGIAHLQILSAPISTLVKHSLSESGLDNKSALRCKNIFALGLICWLFNYPAENAVPFLKKKFSKKEAIMHANLKVLTDGFNYGANTHASVSTYKIEGKQKSLAGVYRDVNGNHAVAYGLIAAAEKAGMQLFLGSYPITPATEILQELAARKELGVRVVQCEDEIAGVCTAIGASFAGNMGATSTSGPGLALKSEAIGLAVMAEIPLVVVDVQRGGPSTGLPTKTEQSDLLQALYGRNGECPAVVVAAKTPTDCFEMAFMAGKLSVEHMTPVILLTDGFLANGSQAWRIPELNDYPAIVPPFVRPEMSDWRPYHRNPENLVRYWAIPGMEGFMHRIGGLEKDSDTGAISTAAGNHQKMTDLRQKKVDLIANYIPELSLEGDEASDTLIVGWGGTYGHLSAACDELNAAGKKMALAHFNYIQPLPKNTEEVLSKYKNLIVCELNDGQFAKYLRSKFEGLSFKSYGKTQGQPFSVSEVVEFVKANS